MHISWLDSTKFNDNCEMYNKSNSASRGAALCRSTTASLHFESQAKFKGEKPWRQTWTSNDRLLELTEDLLTFSTLTTTKMLHHLLWECAHFSHLRTACQCQLALSSLGLDGATAHFSQSLRCPLSDTEAKLREKGRRTAGGAEVGARTPPC